MTVADNAALPRFDAWIGGQTVAPASGAYFETVNPYTSRPWAEVARCGEADVDAAVDAAWTAFTKGPWATLSATARGALLRRVGDLIAAHADELAAMEVRDNGKLISEMGAQCAYLPQWYYYYGGLADKIEGAVIPIDKPDTFNYTLHEPLGVVAAITPWNSPLLLLTWKLAPALAAGCTVVVKPSEFTSTSTLRLAELFTEAGFPPGVVNVVTGFGAECGARLVEHPKVAKVAFTGGSDSGARVYQAAAGGLKRCTLELGGKSPNIVFDDAKLDDAVKGAISGIFAATGQTCIAGSRLLVQDGIYDAFVGKLVEFAKTARMGDPMDRATQVGPVTTPPQYEKILSYIQVAKDDGAELLLGGGPAKGQPGTGDSEYFVQPTIFGGVTNRMRIAQEEVFGPVLSIIRFKDDDEAVEIANDIAFGLAAGIWTQSIKRALAVSKAVRAGTVWVNTYRAVSFMSPFGGYKQSGIGRENGIEAINEYLQTKSVWISTADDVPNPFVMR
ncbi:MAG: aldehyde dehydrogenase [Gammaproteobacteria bacterium]|nr:aldehyde dehydrogenase [Gammaproteobacteria bacterium]